MTKQKDKFANLALQPLQHLASSRKKKARKARKEARALRVSPSLGQDSFLSQEAEHGPIEEDYFSKRMSDVTPLRKRKTIIAKEPPSTVSLPTDEELVMDELDALVRGEGDFSQYFSDEYVEGKVPELSPQMLERLRKGEFAWQAFLDLHGMRVEEAREAVEAFVWEHKRRGSRCLLFVHGRGHHSFEKIPVLKQKLIGWVSHGFLRKHVLAFASAPNHDGGPGALYVILR